jgi:hypothetical protein
VTTKSYNNQQNMMKQNLIVYSWFTGKQVITTKKHVEAKGSFASWNVP